MDVRKPRRASHTYDQLIEAPPERVFPLYCPVREADWVAGWDPSVVYTNSGLVEKDCVFTTKHEDRGVESTWVVTEYDTDAFFVQMVKFTPGVTVCRLEIRLAPAGPQKTSAAVTYCHTSLGPEGDAFLEGFTEEFYGGFMREWERAMNHYLKTGRTLDRT